MCKTNSWKSKVDVTTKQIVKNDERQKNTKCILLHNLLGFAYMAWHRGMMFMFHEFKKKEVSMQGIQTDNGHASNG